MIKKIEYLRYVMYHFLHTRRLKLKKCVIDVRIRGGKLMIDKKCEYI